MAKQPFEENLVKVKPSIASYLNKKYLMAQTSEGDYVALLIFDCRVCFWPNIWQSDAVTIFKAHQYSILIAWMPLWN